MNTPPASTKGIDLQPMQQVVDHWIKTYGVKYFAPATNLGILMEETGELARLMVRLYGEQSFKASEKPENEAAAAAMLADEMADVLWVLTCLANQCGVDLTEAFARNVAKKTKRDGERHLQNEKLL